MVKEISFESEIIKRTIDFIIVVSQDYDTYYLTLLKNALKYGMTKDEFWKSDINTYYAYEKAYEETIHENAHIQGYYNFIALSTIFENLFANKGDKPKQYPKENELAMMKKENVNTNKINKNITTEDVEKLYLYRLSQCK